MCTIGFNITPLHILPEQFRVSLATKLTWTIGVRDGHPVCLLWGGIMIFRLLSFAATRTSSYAHNS